MTGRLVVNALVSAGLIACCGTSKPPIVSKSSRDCCVELVARVDDRFTKDERKAIDDGFAAWWDATSGRACVWLTDGERFDFTVVRAESDADFAPFSNAPSQLLGFWYPGLMTLRMNHTDRSKWSTLVVHETSHAFGMAHRDSDPTSIMQSHLVAAMPDGHIPANDVADFFRVNNCH